MAKITKVKGRQVFDSRGNPTIEAEVFSNNMSATAICPSGASTGSFEAYEKRDKKNNKYLGKSVLQPVKLINTIISKKLKNQNLHNQEKIDYIFITVDPKRDTKEKLKTYLNFFDKKIIGLTGDLKIIDDISNKYHVYYSYSDVKSEKEYVVNHTTNLYLLSKTSKLENILPMGMPLKEKIQIIKELITD